MSRTNPKIVIRDKTGILADDIDSRTRRVRILSKLLDNSIPIPGTGWKIGVDPIVGLIPGVGDLIGALLSGYIVLEAAGADVPTLTLTRMIMNVGIDTLLGAVPALGDVFDAAWKSNTRNVALLERHLATGEPGRVKRKVSASLLLAAAALIVIIGAGLALGIFVARLLWGLVTR